MHLDLTALANFRRDIIPFPSCIIAHLSGLRVISFTCSPNRLPDSYASWASIFGVCQSLTILRLHKVTFDSMDDMVQLIWSFPTINAVEVTRCTWRFDTGPEECPGRLRLAELKIANRYPTDILRRFGPAIRKMRIQPYPLCRDDWTALMTYVDLEELHLTLVTPFGSKPVWLADALSHVPGDRLQHLSIIHILQDYGAEMIELWTEFRLDDILSGTHFGGLRQLRLVFDASSWNCPVVAELEEAVTNAFPKCSERGIIKLERKHRTYNSSGPYSNSL
ncbi:hypothetical protein L227DRAFT_656411 [Lentinus tigrinus ALCF2SS1-6]|uniref:F-box domain-containing protein n=2 Tax=Lentinus tigrinus TaxID=5365 RepID=A0A5C2RYG0_9APHY|nr:hypothetical protein L227DRAFT_656411 [Lentinus tigrinus ALCF2SS1-6]